MARHRIQIAVWAIVLSGCACSQALAQVEVIAHWSFDTSSITTDANGILTAADETGAHNATRTNAATGVLPLNSVAGQFGQAADFTNIIGEDATGASRLEIPNLTEIMGPTANDFTVAAWAKTTALGQDNTMLSDWVTTHTYWFNLDNGSATSTRPRGQIRNTTGGDIIAATISEAELTTAIGGNNVADGNWHHHMWTWEKDIQTMSFYVDGNLAATRVSGATDVDVRVSGNVNAHIGWKQDSNDHFSGTLDELWVIEGALNEEERLALRTVNTLTLGVPGDVNGDEVADILDFNIIRDNFQEPGTRAEGDLNGSGLIDLADFRRWKNAVYPGGSASGMGAAVPEPTSAVLILLGALGFLSSSARRRFRQT